MNKACVNGGLSHRLPKSGGNKLQWNFRKETKFGEGARNTKVKKGVGGVGSEEGFGFPYYSPMFRIVRGFINRSSAFSSLGSAIAVVGNL